MRAEVLIGLALCFAGCGSQGGVPPDLSDSLVVEVLIDVHLADARASATGEPADSLRAEALAPHGLDTLRFRQMLDYYAARPEEYLPLYDDALDRLLREQRGVDAPSDTL